MDSFEDDAETSCESAVKAAFAIDATSLDAAQTLASLRLSQGRATDACGVMRGVADRVLHARKIYRERTLMDELKGVSEPQEIAGKDRS